MEINHPKTPLVLLFVLVIIVISIVAINVDNPTGRAIYEQSIIVDSCISMNQVGYYLMENDIYAEDDCLDVNSDNVILDCSGHKLIGNGKGIAISMINRLGVVVKNCNIVNFSQAIYSENSDLRLVNTNIEEIPTVSKEEFEQGVFGKAVDFAKTPSGISFIVIALVAGVVIVAVISRAPAPSKKYDELEKFLILAIRKRHRPEHIKKALEDKGWDKSFIDTYYSKFIKELKQKRK
jgi:hypothetical protein